MDVDRTRPAHASHSPTQSCPQIDSRWQTKERETKGTLEKNSREGNEGVGMDLGLPGQPLCRQTSVADSGAGGGLKRRSVA